MTSIFGLEYGIACILVSKAYMARAIETCMAAQERLITQVTTREGGGGGMNRLPEKFWLEFVPQISDRGILQQLRLPKLFLD